MWYMNGKRTPGTIPLGYLDELTVRKLSVEIPENIDGVNTADLTICLSFSLPDGTAFQTPPLEYADGTWEYTLPLAVLKSAGPGSVQVIAYDNETPVWRSAVSRTVVRLSPAGHFMI